MVQDLTRDGWFVAAQTDSLTELGATKSRSMKAGEVVMAVSGAPGLAAILRTDCCVHDGFVGFRDLDSRLRPIFFVAWLQQQRMRSEREAVGAVFRNLATPQIREWRVPVPPLGLQERFESVVSSIRELDSSSAPILTSKLHAQLISSLSAHAFSAQLTADWRQANLDRLTIEARERDAALKEAGAALFRPHRLIAEEVEELLEVRADGIYAELNREQRYLFQQISGMAGGVPYVRYFSAQQLSDYLKEEPLHRNPQAIEAHLAVFAARGIVILVSREQQTEDTGEFVYGNTYRLPLKDYEPHQGEDREPRFGDNYRLNELGRLANRLRRNLT